MQNIKLDTNLKDQVHSLLITPMAHLIVVTVDTKWGNTQHAKNAHAVNATKQLLACSGYFFEPFVRILLGRAFIFSCVDEATFCFLITRDRYHC